MKYVIIRDDDISYFTKTEALTKLYDPLFEEKKPVNFAVVPKITGNIKLGSHSLYKTREKIDYDPCIPPRFRGYNEDFPLNENKELVEFIRKRVGNENTVATWYTKVVWFVPKERQQAVIDELSDFKELVFTDFYFI